VNNYWLVGEAMKEKETQELEKAAVGGRKVGSGKQGKKEATE
jgi:hypothetical protein